MKTLVFLIAILLLTSAAFGQKKANKPTQFMPNLYVHDLEGNSTDLKTLSAGKVTFIDFWFIPCGPCFVEMNMLHELYAEYRSNPNVSFLTITFSDSSIARSLLENKNTSNDKTYDYFKNLAKLDTFRLPVYFASAKASKSFMEAKDNLSNTFGFSGYPTIFIFDKKGSLLYNRTGFLKDNEQKQKAEIENVINGKL